MFQIPLGTHPFHPGTTVVAEGRPWFGFGVCEIAMGGRFCVRFLRNGSSCTLDDAGLAELRLREVHAGEIEPAAEVPPGFDSRTYVIPT